MESRKKELKKGYLAAPPAMGVFQIRNMVSGKALVLSSLNLQGLINRHRLELVHGSHRNKGLQADWDALGQESFAFEVLDELSRVADPERDYREELKLLESFWAEREGAYVPDGYTPVPKDRETRLREIAASRLKRMREEDERE